MSHARLLGLAAVLGACGACTSLHDWRVSEASLDGGAGVDAARDGGGVDAGCTGTVCADSCVNLANDVHHCGSCTNDCTLLPRVLRNTPGIACVAGRCVLPPAACDTGYADCVGPTDGCETPITDAANCGGCAQRCSGATPLCDSATGTCTGDCGAGRTLCGDSCVDTAADARNCGVCGNVCSAIPFSRSVCDDGVCGFNCLPTYHDCVTVCAPDDSPLACGMSCSPCPDRAMANETCDGMSCGYACQAGFHDCGGVCVSNSSVLTCGASCSPCMAPAGVLASCDGTACQFSCAAGDHMCGDRCLSRQSPLACGDSCVPCPARPNAVPTCDGTSCGFECAAGFADCNGMASDGCEADLSRPERCGACTTRCSNPTALCGPRAGGGFQCVAGCTGGQTLCGTTCVDLATSTTHCTRCNNTCPAVANGRAVCAASGCGATCDAGFHACGTACVANTSVDGCGTSCSACPAPANAMATCDGTSCGSVCDIGFHRCGGVCVSDLSLSSCGTSCSPCTPPANATATCNGTACGYVCNAGFRRCGDQCVSVTSTSACGASCTPCVPPPNASPVCDGTSCSFECNAGFHRCGDACVSDSLVSSCGTSCTPCTPPGNGTATCDGTSCGFTCDAGFHRCGNACVRNDSLSTCGSACTPCPERDNAVSTCNGIACGFTCSPGFADCDGQASNGCEADLGAAETCGTCARRCSGATPVCSGTSCVASCSAPTTACGAECADFSSDPQFCGSCTNVCSAPAQASPRCASSMCSFACDPGYHRCGSACLADDSPASCGATCTPCTAPASGTPTCESGACSFVCNDGFHRCGSACEPNSSPLTCGSACSPCPTPINGRATCDGVSCDFACNTGFHACGSACVNDTSTATCGDRCVPCAPPANATATCDGSACGFACNQGFLPSGGGCVAIGAPRPVAPGSTSISTTQAPTLRWALTGSLDGARVELCRDRACATPVRTLDVVGSSVTVAPLDPGVWFWRLFGRVGAETGITASATWQLDVGHRSSGRATVWGATLDANADGYADAQVGAPDNAAVYSYRGASGGLTTTPNRTRTGPGDFGRSIAAAGDVNGDGFGDLLVGSPSTQSALLFYGSSSGYAQQIPTTTVTGSAGFGASVAAAGDVDGDGYGDVLVGAPDSATAVLFYGSAAGLRTSGATVLSVAGGTFGASVAGACDLDGDGFADLLVGDPDLARVSVYPGAAGGFGMTASPSETLTGGTGFGRSVSCAGDPNGDGFLDVLVGAPESGAAVLFAGSASGVQTSGVTLTSGSAPSLGSSVAWGGDVDGDGFDDLLVGSSSDSIVVVFFGAASGASSSVELTAAMGVMGFGRSVGSSGDFDRDGTYDVLVGAPGSSVVAVYSGPLRANAVPSAMLGGPLGAAFGESVAWSVPRSVRCPLCVRRVTVLELLGASRPPGRGA